MPPHLAPAAVGSLSSADRVSIRRQVLLLAWPVVVQSLMRTMMFLVDTYILGHYGDPAKAEAAVASTAVINPIANTVAMVLSAFGTGALAIVARATGEGDRAKQRREAATAMACSVVVGFALLPVAMVALPAFADVFRISSVALANARGFLSFTALAVPFILMEVVGSAALRGAGDTRMPMVFSLVANGLNVAGTYALVFGRWGLPEMGVVGAGLSTCCCLALQGLLTMGWLHLRSSAVTLGGGAYRGITRDSLVRLIRVTGPAAIEPLILQSGFLIFIGAMTVLGDTAMAGHRTAVGIESLAFMPGYGFSVACGALVGQYLGAGRPDRAEEGFRVSAQLAVGVMVTLGVVFLVVPEHIVRFFVPGNPGVERAASACLRISALELPFLALAMVLGGALRGAGDTRSPLIVAAIGQWVVRIPLSWLLAIQLGWGIAGAWVTMVVDWGARAAIFWVLWKRGRWKTLKL